MNAPTVSLVMTTFNAARFVRASLRAALAQTYRAYEVVVIDDGSTDDTAEICASIQDPRLRFYRVNRVGRCRALNMAVDLARGVYIANNDADDLSLPDRLSYVMRFAERHEDLAMLGTAAVPVREFAEDIPELQRTQEPTAAKPGSARWPSKLLLYRRNLFNHSTIVYPKRTWRLMGGYDEGLGMCEDYDFYLRALQFGRAALLPQATVMWLTESGGYFRQKSTAEYLKTLAAIKKRAFRLLGLPVWMRPYHPLWVQAYRASAFAARIRTL